jgi:hypothetical protein
MTDELVAKLLVLGSNLDEAERANFKLVLSLAAGGLTPGFDRPNQGTASDAFDAVSQTLVGLQPYKNRVGSNGIAYRGRPEFLTDELLRSLQSEAAELRPSAHRFDEHFLGCGAPIANQLATSKELSEFVRLHAGDVKPNGVASFLFYDEEGQGIEPHIDTDVFALNVLIMLSHRRGSGRSSALVVFPPRGEPERLELQPGELLILFAGSIAHGREPIQAGEAVSILTLGFHPLGI